MSAAGTPIVERVEVRPEWPHFAGHFEGRPIVPGIAHLQLVRDAVRRAAGADVDLVALEALRWRRLVTPGDVLEVGASPRGEGRWSFEVRCGHDLASQGRVGVGPPRVAEPGDDPGVISSGTFPPPEALIPHRGAALLLAGVSESTADRLVAVAVVPPGSPFVAEGVAASFVALEIAAQAAAVFEALRRRQAGGPAEPRVGYLVGAREARLEAALPVGSAFRVTVRLEAAVPPLSTYRFQVGGSGTVIARGAISTYLT